MIIIFPPLFSLRFFLVFEFAFFLAAGRLSDGGGEAKEEEQ